MFRKIYAHISEVSIYGRIVIGNSTIIIIGAIGGTLVTRKLTNQAADLSLIIFFALIGIFFSILLNGLILKSALKPLYNLQVLIQKLKEGDKSIDTKSLGKIPDIAILSNTISDMVSLIEEKNSRLAALSRQAIVAQEEERKRIARSLHDDTGQSLSTLIFNLELLEDRVPESNLEFKKTLESNRILAIDTLKELRKIIFDLRPSILDDLGLIPAIRWYAKQNLEMQNIQLSFISKEDPVLISNEAAIALFRIAQESVNNIIRHAKASKVNIMIKSLGDKIVLEIYDNGIGFDSHMTTNQAIDKKQWGLMGIRERAEQVGGIVTLTSSNNNGTQLKVEIPTTIYESQYG